jgi:TolA-binding protein
LNYQVDAQAKTISDHETRIRSIEDIIVQISNLNKDITKLSEDMEDVKTQSIQNSSLKNDMRELISKLNNEDDNRRRKEIDRR